MSLPENLTEALASFTPLKRKLERENSDPGKRRRESCKGDSLERGSFEERVLSYSPQDWDSFLPLSPLEASSWGWKLKKGKGRILKCVSCDGILVASLPKTAHPQTFLKMVENLGNKLRVSRDKGGGHHKFCPWLISSCPLMFREIRLAAVLNQRASFIKEYLDLWWIRDLKTLLSFPDLPYVPVSKRPFSLPSLQIIKDSLSSRELESHCLEAALVLAICGWVKKTDNVLTCRLCQRRCGLWNFSLLEDHASKVQKERDDQIDLMAVNSNKKETVSCLTLSAEPLTPSCKPSNSEVDKSKGVKSGMPETLQSPKETNKYEQIHKERDLLLTTEKSKKEKKELRENVPEKEDEVKENVSEEEDKVKDNVSEEEDEVKEDIEEEEEDIEEEEEEDDVEEEEDVEEVEEEEDVDEVEEVADDSSSDVIEIVSSSEEEEEILRSDEKPTHKEELYLEEDSDTSTEETSIKHELDKEEKNTISPQKSPISMLEEQKITSEFGLKRKLNDDSNTNQEGSNNVLTSKDDEPFKNLQEEKNLDHSDTSCSPSLNETDNIKNLNLVLKEDLSKDLQRDSPTPNEEEYSSRRVIIGDVSLEIKMQSANIHSKISENSSNSNSSKFSLKKRLLNDVENKSTNSNNGIQKAPSFFDPIHEHQAWCSWIVPGPVSKLTGFQTICHILDKKLLEDVENNSSTSISSVQEKYERVLSVLNNVKA